MLSVRRITPEDGDTLQRVRLAALRDAPSAFASVHAEEARRSAAEWSTRAAAGSSGFDRVTFFAVDAGEPVGLVGGFRPYPESADIELVSMWTAPPARRTGAGTLLVEALVGWAADGGADEVDLWVTEGNGGAFDFYRRAGFTETEERAPLRPGSVEEVIRMRRAVT